MIRISGNGYYLDFISSGIFFRKKIGVIPFFITGRRADTFCRPQRSTELLGPAENTSFCPIWPVYMGVQNIG